MSKDTLKTVTSTLSTSSDSTPVGVTGTQIGNKRALDVASISGSPLSSVLWRSCDIQQTSAAVETYVFYEANTLSGTVVATCTVTYTSAAKSALDTVVWS